MFWLLLFLLEVSLLFLISRILTKTLSIWLYHFTQDQQTTIHVLAFLFLPGVIVHELAHWFVASILFVRTGDIEFMPKVIGNTIKLGSVAIAKTDVFRRFVIGVAPVLVGIMSFLLLLYIFGKMIPGYNWQTILFVYICFEIGNTMFSSKKDMEGALGLLIAAIIVFVLGLFFGLRVHIDVLSIVSLPVITAFFQKMNILLLIPLGLDIAVCGVSYTLGRYLY